MTKEVYKYVNEKFKLGLSFRRNNIVGLYIININYGHNGVEVHLHWR